MLSSLPPTLKGILSCTLLFSFTTVLGAPLIATALLKFIIPVPPIQKLFTRLATLIAETWMRLNNIWIALFHSTQFDVRGLENLNPKGWYLITANHQSWGDIFVMQKFLVGRIPMPKFFLKQQLIWVPVIGLCWWALDFPFMKRHSKEYLAKHPEKRGEDLATTRRACEKFKDSPVSIVNYLEGTRFTAEKHQQQNSPYQYLLKPKAGGVGFVLSAMGEQLHSLINITLYYQGHIPGFWDFMCGNTGDITMLVETCEIPEKFLGRDYGADEQFQQELRDWINALWQEKDQQLALLHEQ